MIFNHVYYVCSPNSDILMGAIAIRPELSSNKKKISWEDTSGNISVLIKEIDFNGSSLPPLGPERIKITSDRGEDIELQLLTLDIYNAKIKPIAVDPPAFQSTDAVQAYYLTTNFLRYE